MNPWNHFYAQVGWPLLDRSYQGLAGRLRSYQRLEEASAAQVQAWQWQRLRQLLQHAHATSRFYRRRMDESGLDPQRMQDPSELQALPPLTRDDLRRHGPDICSSAYTAEQLFPSFTGGTTDAPIPLWRDLECLRTRHAVQEHFHLWAGLRPGDKVYNFWGARADFAERPRWRRRMLQRYVLRCLFAPSSYLDPATLERYREEMNRFRPRVLRAFPTPLAVWAEHLLQCARPYHRPKGVVVTAEMLHPEQRALIERAFACPVREHYGSRDFGMIAAQCERGQGLHLNPLSVYLETRPVAGSEGLQELLVTDLTGFGMPLIRYQINDCVQGTAECDCGRAFPVLAPLVGRSADLFHLPNGAVVPGVNLDRVAKSAQGVMKLQIIQETRQEFRLRYVAGPGFRSEDLVLLRRRLDEFLQPELDWTFEAVNDIAREASGKTRFCICRYRPHEVAPHAN